MKCSVFGCSEAANDGETMCTFHLALTRPVWPRPTEKSHPHVPMPLVLGVFGRVAIDLEARNQHGFKLHGKELRPDDPRDFLQEAYEEALDLAVYLKAELMKRDDERRAHEAAENEGMRSAY